MAKRQNLEPLFLVATGHPASDFSLLEMAAEEAVTLDCEQLLFSFGIVERPATGDL